MGMIDAGRRLELIASVQEKQLENNNDDEGDKFLSSADGAMEVIGFILDAETEQDPMMLRAAREGWFA
jgi:hypothetical protein